MFKGKEIIPGLFLGNRLAALNSDWLRHNVAFIVNAAGELRNYYERQKKEKKAPTKLATIVEDTKTKKEAASVDANSQIDNPSTMKLLLSHLC